MLVLCMFGIDYSLKSQNKPNRSICKTMQNMLHEVTEINMLQIFLSAIFSEF